MRVRPALLASAAAAAVLAAPLALAAPGDASFTDAAGDANFTAMVIGGGTPTPVGSQAYADVVAVTWSPDRVGGKVVGFTVTTTLTAPPTPPAQTAVVYRMLGKTEKCPYVGPVFYTSKSSDPSIPQSALRDNCTGETRLTPIPMPKVNGSTITWKVPLSALPKEAPAGTTLTDLYFEVNEIEDFRGLQVPGAVPLIGGVYGLGTGQIDFGSSSAAFKLG